MRWLGCLWVLALPLQSLHAQRFAEVPAALCRAQPEHLALPGHPGHDRDHCPACQLAGTKAAVLPSLPGARSLASPLVAWCLPPDLALAAAPFLRGHQPRAPPRLA